MIVFKVGDELQGVQQLKEKVGKINPKPTICIVPREYGSKLITNRKDSMNLKKLAKDNKVCIILE